MAVVTIELPTQQRQTRFNLRRWSELLADAELYLQGGRAFAAWVAALPRVSEKGAVAVNLKA
ncbi:MAG: hypothetical protein ACREIC_15965 [Limisphaerales bacterium]